MILTRRLLRISSKMSTINNTDSEIIKFILCTFFLFIIYFPGVQVQFHTVPPPPQQIITSLGNAQIQHPPQAPQSQLIENQRAPQHQIIINASIPPQPPPPPPFTALQYSAQEVSKVFPECSKYCYFVNADQYFECCISFNYWISNKVNIHILWDSSSFGSTIYL